MNHTIRIVFNEGVAQDYIDTLVVELNIEFAEMGITAVIFVDEQEEQDEPQG